MSWVRRQQQSVERQWQALGERQSSLRDALVVAVVASLVFPVALIVIGRQFPPLPDADPELFYSIDHRTIAGNAQGDGDSLSHVYSVTLGNRGPSLDDGDSAEFMLLFRDSIISVSWNTSPTRDSVVEQCEGREGQIFHYYLRFTKLSRNGYFVVVVKAKNELSHVPKLHLHNLEYDMEGCRSTTQEGIDFCEGRGTTATTPYDDDVGTFNLERECSKLSG